VDEKEMTGNAEREGERVISHAELRRYDGEGGKPKFIAHRGVVYDVTKCPKWLADLHEGMHWPGQDLTGELEEAPHKVEVFARPCVRRVGILQKT
jgi:predicted heme/steroid binding protein